MMTTIHLMLERGLAPEDVDAITGIAMAHPKSATFRTADVVGLDTVGHVAANCYKTLTTDEIAPCSRPRVHMSKMIERASRRQDEGWLYKKSARLQTLRPEDRRYRGSGGNADIAKATKTVASSPIRGPREGARRDAGRPASSRTCCRAASRMRRDGSRRSPIRSRRSIMR
jgi:3-hydroxyacyl-CoA dehydrogenase